MNNPPQDIPNAPARHEFPTIRGQFIWASIFPLVSFGLLTILLITVAMHNVALNLILQRNTGQAQSAAAYADLALDNYVIALKAAAQDVTPNNGEAVLTQHAADLALFSGGTAITDLKGVVKDADPGHPQLLGRDFSTLPGLGTVKTNRLKAFSLLANQAANTPAVGVLAVPVMRAGQYDGMLVGLFSPAQMPWLDNVLRQSSEMRSFYLVDAQGNPLAYGGSAVPQQSSSWSTAASALISRQQPQTTLVETASSSLQVLVSYAPLGSLGWGLVMEEDWSRVFAPALYYEWVLAGLLALGIALSMLMLSVSVGRVIRPLEELSRQANRLRPGSIFKPMTETGPEELRALFHAFNQMVISLAEQQEALREYARKALLSQEEERARISRDLHDETVQELVGLVQRVDLCRDEMDSDPAQARRRLDELRNLAVQALDDLRRISNDLRPPILQDLGLATALQSLCDDFKQNVPNIHCHYEAHEMDRRLPPEMELAIFRVIQEALSNIRRHSKGTTRVEVKLDFGEFSTTASVHDNGRVFPIKDVQALVREGHLGMAGMYERAHLFNGDLQIASTPAEGTMVILTVPLPERGI